jgi:hypothetical protein
MIFFMDTPFHCAIPDHPWMQMMRGGVLSLFERLNLRQR